MFLDLGLCNCSDTGSCLVCIASAIGLCVLCLQNDVERRSPARDGPVTSNEVLGAEAYVASGTDDDVVVHEDIEQS